MRLALLGPNGEETPALVDEDGGIYDLGSFTPDIDGKFLASDGIARCRDALGRGKLPRVDAQPSRWGAPIAKPPSIICIGMNYAAHAAETGSAPPRYLIPEPGDVVLTVTPEGVALSGRFPYLAAGDVCEVEIEGVGRQCTTFVADGSEAR